ncbi:hypothetical protein BsWGS_01583 [Bradybaena similaris]
MKAVIIVALCVCVFVSEVACWSRYRPQPKYSGTSDDKPGKPVAPRRWRPVNKNRPIYTPAPYSGRRYRPINGK